MLPRIRYEDFRRGLVLLDPYGLHLSWNVIRECGHLGTIDMFLNFPIADMNRNVFWHNPDGVDEADIARMTQFWGDETWREIAYEEERVLWGTQPKKQDNEVVAEAFRKRLRDVAGFKNVPEPLPMRNSNNAIVYYLFFASKNDTGNRIVNAVFNKFR